MGLDAESTDLTARIQRRRAALVAAGEVEPARPGEHRLFRGQPGAVPLPRSIPTRGAHRIVPVDETPTRGGREALEETAETSAADGVAPSPESPPVARDGEGTEGGSDDPVANVNEFGEVYDPSDDGGFNLDKDGDRIDAVAAMAQHVEDWVDAMMPSTRGASQASDGDPSDLNKAPQPASPRARKRTALSALDAYAYAFDQQLGELITAFDRRLDGVEQGIILLYERLDGIERGLLLVAEAVAPASEVEAASVTGSYVPLFDSVTPDFDQFPQPTMEEIGQVPERRSFLRHILKLD